MSDALRYHMHDTVAAKDLLFRRLRCLANYENANKVRLTILIIQTSMFPTKVIGA